jgi:hypothetical protein
MSIIILEKRFRENSKSLRRKQQATRNREG